MALAIRVCVAELVLRCFHEYFWILVFVNTEFTCASRSFCPPVGSVKKNYALFFFDVIIWLNCAVSTALAVRCIQNLQIKLCLSSAKKKVSSDFRRVRALRSIADCVFITWILCWLMHSMVSECNVRSSKLKSLSDHDDLNKTTRFERHFFWGGTFFFAKLCLKGYFICLGKSVLNSHAHVIPNCTQFWFYLSLAT